MSETCGCCEGLHPLTPLATANRPGLSALTYRVGTHATFLATMKARLSAGEYGALARLTARNTTDPAIAMLDAWATVADVLTFYQERIVNECYLRTASERRSILELARMVGYTLRPGVAASVYLAFTLEGAILEGGRDLEISAGTRAQSLPVPGQLPQSFETAETLQSNVAWNNLEPRMTRPQYLTLSNADQIDTLYFEGMSTNLEPNDTLLLVFGDGPNKQVPRRVKSVELQAAENRTKVTLQNGPTNIGTFIRALGTTVDEYLDPQKFRNVLQRKIAKERVLPILFPILVRLLKVGHGESPGQLAGLVEGTLPLLRKELADVQRYPRLKEWVGGLLGDLERAMSMLPVDDTLASPHPSSVLDTQVASPADGDGAPPSVEGLAGLLASLSEPPATHPASRAQLVLSATQALSSEADAVPQLLSTLDPTSRPALYTAWKNATVTPPVPVQVYAMRITAPLFGNNAFKKPLKFDPQSGNITETGDWPIIEVLTQNKGRIRIVHEEKDAVHLDASYDQILPESWLIVKTGNTRLTDKQTLIVKAKNPNATISRDKYGLVGKTTRIELGQPSDLSHSLKWIKTNLRPSRPTDDDFQAIRGTTVYAQSEALTLAEEPITDPVCGARIELGDLYGGLDPGRWLVVSGERVDIKDATGDTVEGVKASELVMLAGVVQSVHQINKGDNEMMDLPGDKPHSTLVLANGGLNYCYRLDTITIYGNVAKATHGETSTEVLGSGDASEALQQLTLRRSPLTYLAAPTPDGIESTLEVFVNGLQWREARSLAELGPTDRSFITRTDNQDQTTLVFGDGVRGARLPTGAENVEAVYRTGIGEPGNAVAEQISQLADRPRGLQGVINPLPATGGADRDTLDEARRNTPLAVMALDRLVSVRDYEDFARAFAGIGKASATRLSDGSRQIVHLTIAGAKDIAIAEDSDLYRSLVQALRKFGDPRQPLRVELRRLLLLFIRARVRVLPDHRWELVEHEIREALLSTFDFEARDLGQDALLSEVISTIQWVRGVAYVDVDTFGAIPEELTRAETGEEITRQIDTLVQSEGEPPQRVQADLAGPPGGPILPAQLAFLSREAPDTLYLEEIPS